MTLVSIEIPLPYSRSKLLKERMGLHSLHAIQYLHLKIFLLEASANVPFSENGVCVEWNTTRCYYPKRRKGKGETNMYLNDLS